MKKIFILMIIVIICSEAYGDDISAFRNLLSRVAPQYLSSITVQKLPEKGYDYFQLSSADNKLTIGGNNANSMAVGLNYYFKYYCNTTFSWHADDHFDLPGSMPEVSSPVMIRARCNQRFFLNYCTFGYTMVWWGWKEWEHFIDWMALNGINLPLAITGQESVWRKVWMEMGLSDQEIRKYFTGPAYLPWHRMNNIDYWQGNLPMSWLNDQEELQKKIVSRERELNMRPVLPAFAGHVPQELKRIYPDARISKLTKWGGFTEDYICSFLDPMDPLFPKIQSLFLAKQKELYGTDHIYGIDLFNEVQPPSLDPEYLKRVGNGVYKTLEKSDKKAVWLQMTWLFYMDHDIWTNERIKAYITSYPQDKSLLLDYFCENYEVWKNTDRYFDVPFIWCYLGNFGGNTMLSGNIHDVNNRIEETFKNGGKNFAGLGSTLEGFDCNPVMYEYLFEKAWDINTTDITGWAIHLADERIGKAEDNGRKAWMLLTDSIYVSSATFWLGPVINVRPTFEKLSVYIARHPIPYDNRKLLDVVDLLLKTKSTSTAYRYDVVNMTRQMLGNLFADVYKSYLKAYEELDYPSMKVAEETMMQIIYDTDKLVSTQSPFLLGKWIKAARDKGVSEEEKLYYERNARSILTTWGDKGSALTDYANRSWAGLTSTFYAERWKMFFAAVNHAVLNGKKLEGADLDAYFKDVTEFEKRWWNDCIGDFSTEPTGDGIAISEDLYNKYRMLIENGGCLSRSAH
jgi:alpha-N-acetylglucosaminidase